MTISVHCACGKQLRARQEFAGTRAECPYCGRNVSIPNVDPGGNLDALEITEFLDPPRSGAAAAAGSGSRVEGRATSEAAPQKPPRPLIERLLDPQSIQAMLMLGGGVCVLGIVVWLVSLGLFKDARVLAVSMGVGTAAILACGWWLALKTRYQSAGAALTFFACVVAPLNLWFHHAQGLVTLEGSLWVEGLVCCLVYIATVFALKRPVFLYAVEIGATLTGVLFLGQFGLADDGTWFVVLLTVLAALSIHAERAFSPTDPEFDRKRYGLPVFWSGQLQLAVALISMLIQQAVAWVAVHGPYQGIDPWRGNRLTDDPVLAGTIWLAAAYLYLYSDLVVRRLGIYLWLTAVSVVMALINLVFRMLEIEAIIALLSAAGLAVAVLRGSLDPARRPKARQDAAADAEANSASPVSTPRMLQSIDTLTVMLAFIPVLIGMTLHLRATSVLGELWAVPYTTNWMFVAAMAVVMVCNRAAAFLLRENRSAAACSFFFSAAAAVVGAAGILRLVGIAEWPIQAAVLMLIPIAYMAASGAWHGRSPEQPLYWVAHTAAAVLLVHVLGGSLQEYDLYLKPVERQTANLWMSLFFTEAALFYMYAAELRRRHANVLLAASCAALAAWQLMGYFGVPAVWYTVVFAVIGLLLLAASRVVGLDLAASYSADGRPSVRVRGPGRGLHDLAHGILSVALLAAFLQGVARLPIYADATAHNWNGLISLVSSAAAAVVAAGLAPTSGWRRAYAVAGIILAALTLVTLHVLLDLNGWRKFEIFLVAVGLMLLTAGFVGRSRESDRARDEGVSAALWFGTWFVVVPLFVAVLYHRSMGDQISLPDELILITALLLLSVAGIVGQVKSCTLIAVAAFTVYAVILVGRLAYQPQVAIGVYLAIGGGAVFLIGLLLSMSRDRLISLPGRIARREGWYRVLDWR